MMMIMVLLNPMLYLSALVFAGTLALAQEIRLPVLQDYSPPEEVNALQGNLNNSNKVQRSISEHAGVDNTEDTIREVERLIQSNPELPRLTRGEILDILDNITKQDQSNLLKSLSKESDRDPKALMVVKAYTPLGSGEVNVEEFYTKPPITSIVENDDDQLNAERVTRTTTSTTNVPSFFRRKPSPSRKPSEVKQSGSLTKKTSSSSRGNVQFKLNNAASPSTTTTSTYTTTTEKLDITTTRSRDIKRRRRPLVTISTTTTTTTQMPATTYRPRRRQPPKKEVQYSNHKYPLEHRPKYPSGGIRIVRPPATAQTPLEINSELEDLLPQEMENEETFMPMPSPPDNNKYYNSVSEPSIELEIPEHLKKVVADLNLAAIKDPESVSVTSIVPKEDKSEADKIKELLASIGVLPPTSTASPNANAVADSLSPDMQELLKSFGLLPDSNNNINNNGNEIIQPSSPEFNPEKAEIHPESYVGFKPLPEDGGSRKEMEDLLAQFGLLDKSARSSKSLKRRGNNKDEVKIERISLEAVPDEFKPVLQQMGFDPARVGRKIREQPNININNNNYSEQDGEKTILSHNSSAIKKQHVFNPADPDKYDVSEEELKKLGRLLEIMKKLEKLNGTITEEDVNQIEKEELKELITSLNASQRDNNNVGLHLNEQNAPNPIEDDNDVDGLTKNEVKRQESSTTTTELVETVTAESVIPDEETNKATGTPSLKDLEDSFGGSTETITEALPESTTAARSGFYYLLDWNTFFDIDDQKGKRVNLRFQPKVGDPKRFFSVNVP